MNRLWVRISLVILFVTLIVGVFPVATRRILFPPNRARPASNLSEQADRPPPEISSERLAQIQERERNRTWQTVAWTLGFSSIIGCAVGVWLSRGVVAPLTELENGALEVAAANLSYRVPVGGTDEMRSVAEAFNAMANALERSQQVQRNMLADVTHELRHPVHVLQGNLQGILDGVFPLEMNEVALLVEQTQQLSRLVADLHELALAEAHELPLEKQVIDLNQLVHDLVEVLAPMGESDGIKLHAVTTAAPVLCAIDARRIQQVVHNLIDNSFRYTRGAGNIRCAVAIDGGDAVISVSDDGIGIDAIELPHVFDRFYRSDRSRDRSNGGTGLGLAIVKGIVEAHGGRVDVASGGSDQGATFRFWLPRVD